MSKYKSRCAFLYLTPSYCRVVEGENKSGHIDIKQFFAVAGMDQHFTPSSNNISGYEITSISGIVNDIITEFRNKHVKTKRVFLASNYLGIDTQIECEEPKGNILTLLMKDIGKSNKDNQAKKKAETKNTQNKTIIESKTSWGDVTVAGVTHSYTSITTADKFLLQTIVQEFYSRGYTVVGISNCISQLFNLRQSEVATFDSQSKVIFDIDTKVTIATLVRDVPVKIQEMPLTRGADIFNLIHNNLKGDADLLGHNPRVYLTGEAFVDLNFYFDIANRLDEKGYSVCDVCNLPDAEDERIEASMRGEASAIITPDYSTCLAELLCAYSKNIINVVPSLDISEVFKSNSVGIAKGALALTVISALTGVGFSALRGLNYLEMNGNPSRVSAMQSEITTLNTTKSMYDETIATLTQSDTTITEVMKFITANKDANINVVSVDTNDMLLSEFTTEDGVIISGGSAEGTLVTDYEMYDEEGMPMDNLSNVPKYTYREPIIIRGYARTGSAAVDYYNKLHKYDLPFEPILNGVEKYTLPNGQEAYIFEIQIGGGEV